MTQEAKARLLQHEAASTNELVRWYKETYPTAAVGGSSKKKFGVLIKEATTMLRPCPHSQFEELSHCKACWSKVCSRCWKVACREKLSNFELMSYPAQVKAITDALHVPLWHARALLRNAEPMPDRLAYSAGAKRPVLKESDAGSSEGQADGSTEMPPGDASPDVAEAEEEAEEDGAKPSEGAPKPAPRPKADWERVEVFDRLCKPREEKLFPEIPYLPELNVRLPKFEDLCALAEEGGDKPPAAEDDFEGLLEVLEERQKIKTWQVGALKWCAKPVFERLYESSAAAAALATASRYRASPSPSPSPVESN